MRITEQYLYNNNPTLSNVFDGNSLLKLDKKKLAAKLTWLRCGTLQSRRLLEILPLFHSDNGDQDVRAHYAAPLESLNLVEVPNYGTMVLKNKSHKKILIVPMHCGFFQAGAQNHATSRTLILDAGETLTAKDCFCIQQAQGGLLKKAEQRFMMLPLAIRHEALQLRHKDDYSRLWHNIDEYNRYFGIAKGGHLERFFRPYFSRLIPFRHYFEQQRHQIGAAYFISGRFVGLELAPNPSYWDDLWPVLQIYCYGPAVLQAERLNWQPARQPLNLNNLSNLNDLEQRLKDDRKEHRQERMTQVQDLLNQKWREKHEDDRCGLRVITLTYEDWAGQYVKEQDDIQYLSLFRKIK